MLTDYVENTYHQTIHSSIKMKPIDKYMEHIDKIRFISSKQELDNAFLYRFEHIKVRYDPVCLDNAYIFDDEGNCVSTIYPVNKVNNSKIIRDSAKVAADFSTFNVNGGN